MFFFVKQKSTYGGRISTWISDVSASGRRLLPGLGSTTPAGGFTVAVLTSRSRLAARSGGRGTGHHTRNPRQEPRHEQRHRDGSPCPGRSHPQLRALAD